jgi:hypothetical protein
MRRLIRPPRGQFFTLHVRLVHYTVRLEPLLIGNSPVAARSCERMSLHLPGLRHTLKHYTFDQDGTFLDAS